MTVVANVTMCVNDAQIKYCKNNDQHKKKECCKVEQDKPAGRL